MVQRIAVEMMLAVLWNFTAVVMQEEVHIVKMCICEKKADFELHCNIMLNDLNADYGEL
jgi:hypothetical protein